MAIAQSKQTRESVGHQLTEANAHAEAGRYNEALFAVRLVKANEPGNVYVLAFERQVEQLIELSQMNILSDDQRLDILESIPGIIDRAVDGTPLPPPTRTPKGSQVRPIQPEREKEEKAAALEWLKNSYFQHAHEYVQKGEYPHALAEIRRVYIIDPANDLAEEFEQQIQQLAALQKLQGERRHPAIRPVQKTPPEVLIASESQRKMVKESRAQSIRKIEATPAMTEEWSAPGVPLVSPAALDDRAPGARPGKPKYLRTFVIFLLIIILGATIYFYWTHQYKQKQSPLGRSTAISAQPAETFAAATAQIPEQSYAISATDNEPGTQSPQVSEVNPSDEGSTPEEMTTVQGQSGKSSDNDNPETPVPPSARKSKQRPGKAIESPATQKPAASTRVDAPPILQASSSPEGEKYADSETPKFESIEKDPRIIKLEKPRFPDFVYAKGLEGQVVIQVKIDPQGKPVQTRILKSTNGLLDNAVTDAVMKSQFSPGQMASGPVAAWMTIPFKFELKR